MLIYFSYLFYYYFSLELGMWMTPDQDIMSRARILLHPQLHMIETKQKV